MASSLFDVNLFAVGDEGAGFRYEDMPTYLTGYRRSGMAVSARLAREIQVEKSSGTVFETLLVLTFGFTTAGPKKRFQHAEITLTFKPPKKSYTTSYIELVGVSPNDTNYINLTPRSVESSLTWGATTYIVTPIGPIAGRPLEKSTKSTYQVTDMGQITGDSYPDGIWSQTRCNVAIFTLSENPVQKQGIPSHFTVALVLRSNAGKFLMETEIKATAGFVYNMAEATEKLFGKVSRSESIEFLQKPEPKVLLKWEKVHGEIANEISLKKVMLDKLTEIQEVPLLPVKDGSKTGA